MTSDDTARSWSALEGAVNDSAGKVAILWTSFITLGTYLLIATGSVTQRDLFLDSAIKLPVLGVDLPVTGYFLVAPIIFLIFHFYLLMQLEGLTEKVADYNAVLHETVKVAADRRLLRRRLDDFPFLQFLAGVRERRTGVAGALQIGISWITIVAFPLVIFLQLQIAFLPYHSAPATWLQRICLMGDLGLIWFFWPNFQREIGWSRRKVFSSALGIVLTIVVVAFSLFVTTFPGEAIYRNPVSRAIDALTSRVFRNSTITASRFFYEGDVDGVTGQPASLFANRIILPGERFFDAAKSDKAAVPASLRGRDLRGAILPRSDLRFADFTGAILVEASFVGANLQGARFGCAAKLAIEASGRAKRRAKADSCDEERGADLRGADFTDAVMYGTNFNYAKLQGARFMRSMMQGASLDDADLTAATFTFARLEGASMARANLFGISLFSAQMQGADLTGATLTEAALLRTQLQGAVFDDADLANADFNGANIYRAFIDVADRKDVLFLSVSAKPVFPVFRIAGQSGANAQPSPAMLDAQGYNALVTRALDGIQDNAVKQFIAARLQVLDPSKKIQDGQFVSDNFIKSDTPTQQKVRAARLKALSDSLCDASGAPFVARGYIYNGRILGVFQSNTVEADDPALHLIATLRSGNCPGAVGLDVNDFQELNRVEREILRMRNPQRDIDSDDDADGHNK